MNQNLRADRFSTYHTFTRGFTEELLPTCVYSYETYNDLYDILVIEGYENTPFARKNMRALTNDTRLWEAIHVAICEHFAISLTRNLH